MLSRPTKARSVGGGRARVQTMASSSTAPAAPEETQELVTRATDDAPQGGFINDLTQAWKDIEEDEDGNLVVGGALGREKRLREKRERLLTHASTAKRIRRGMIRFVQVVVDLSRASLVADMRPSRLKVVSEELQIFVRKFFDSNPLSQLSICCTRNGVAKVITELSGSPHRHVEHLKLLGTQKLGLDCAGDASVQNCLELATRQLRDVPPYGHREVLFVMTSLTTCDPGDVFEAIEGARKNRMHCSVVGLGAEVHVMRSLAVETKGKYSVVTGEPHLRQVLADYAPPPPSLEKETPSSLVQMGFPNFVGGAGDVSGQGELCFVGAESELGKGRSFACPRCKSRVQDLPQACHVCGLSLVSSAHLARSYHHLFPVPLFAEVTESDLEMDLDDGAAENCSGCGRNLSGQLRLRCPNCHQTYCITCDVFIHEELHNCPGYLGGPPADEARPAEELEEGELATTATAPADSKRKRQEPPHTPPALKRGKLKKLRKKLEQGRGTAQDCYAVYGDQALASIDVRVSEGRRIRVRDVQSFLLWLLAGTGAPNWVGVRNKVLVEKVVVVFASGFLVSALDGKPELVPNVSRILGAGAEGGDGTGFHRVESLALNSSITPSSTVNALLTVPNRKKKTAADAGDFMGKPYSDDFASGKLSVPARQYALTAQQMRNNGYPMADSGMEAAASSGAGVPNVEGFRSTAREGEGGDAKSALCCERLVAMDCEMCHTKLGPELTRVTLVGDTGEVIFDRLVKPENEILNYVTEFSGITPEMLENVTTTLKEVQDEILALVDADTFLVGHSLENDLVALKLMHANCIDTALLYPHNKGPPFKFSLKSLAERYLSKQIQVSGHNPIEDARTAMELLRLKLHFGPGFGEFENDGVSICKILSGHKRCATLLDRPETLRKHAVGSASAVLCRTDEEVCKRSLNECKSSSVNFVWCNFTELYSRIDEATKASVDVDAILDSISPQNTATAGEGAGGSSIAEVLANKQKDLESCSEVVEELRALDDRIGRIHDSLPRNAALVVVSGQGNTPYVRALQHLRWRCRGVSRGGQKDAEGGQDEGQPTSLWDAKCEEHMLFSIKQAAQTICVVGVKR